MSRNRARPWLSPSHGGAAALTLLPPFSSIATRQALLTACLTLAAVAAFALSALATVQASLRADLLHTIDTDIAGLIDGAARGGTDELAARIGDRLAVQTQERAASYYLLRDAVGQRLAGNIDTSPPIDAAHSGFAEAVIGTDPALIRATRLSHGATLMVGRSLGPTKDLIMTLRVRLALLAAGAFGVALAAGWWTSTRLARRVGAINATFRQFEEGDRAVRVAPKGQDELAMLGGHVDRHLSQIDMLLAFQQGISDNVAHELRTPLAHLDTRLRRTIEQAADPALTAELEHARDDVRSIVSLFDALLDIAHGEAGARIPRTSFDLSELAGSLAELYAPSAEEAGLDFSTRIAPAVTMTGEPMQVGRMIANLLDNALKFVPAGARLRLSVTPGPVIIVEDSGPGIAPDERELVMRRFGRGRSSAAGHGLGLALASLVAARHGLVLRLEDAAPGARFVIAQREK